MTPTGQQIIEAVIRSSALQSAEHTATGDCIFIWRANAAEQIEAALEQIQNQTPSSHEN